MRVDEFIYLNTFLLFRKSLSNGWFGFEYTLDTLGYIENNETQDLMAIVNCYCSFDILIQWKRSVDGDT